MKKILSFIFIIFVFYGCKEQKKEESNNSFYTLDLDNSEVEDTVKLSSFFKKINTIILEDHDYAIIGDINQIQIFENYIFVLDELKAKKLFIFDKTGKYVRQIGSLGQGPGEYLSMSDFCIDAEKREVYLVDDWNKKIHKYNFENGKYVSSTKLPPEYNYSHIVLSYDKLYISIRPYYKEKSNNLLMKVDFETGEYREYINADEYNAGWNELATSRSNFFKYKNNTPKFAELFMNTIIAIGKDTVSPYLTINHKDWVREGDFLPFNEYTARQIFIFGDLKRRGRAINIYNYFEWRDIIFFQYMNVTAPLSVVYNKKTKELHQYKYLKNDMLFENRCRSARLTHVNAKAAYEYFSTEDFPVHYDAKDHLVSNLDLSVYLDKREEIIKLREESFMIFEYEFK